MADYDIQIEIDADTGDIIWEKNGKVYYYTVEELEGKGLIDRLSSGRLILFHHVRTSRVELFVSI